MQIKIVFDVWLFMGMAKTSQILSVWFYYLSRVQGFLTNQRLPLNANQKLQIKKSHSVFRISDDSSEEFCSS